MTIEFQAWPKIPRLFRDCIITEKIDGTNAAVGIVPFTADDLYNAPDDCLVITGDNGSLADAKIVYAQSRKRIITPEQDNHGFAAWVHDNAEALIDALGDGLHFGEWWGSGIQRGYGLKNGEKRFSLFNVVRYADVDFSNLPGAGLVPVLYEGLFYTGMVKTVLWDLAEKGSEAAPGFMDPEGIITFHTAANMVFKTTIKDDEKPKGPITE